MKKQKYYSIENIKKHNAQYNLLIGERSNGKSYAAKKEAIEHYFKTGSLFMYLRRYRDDIKGNLVSAYLSDMQDVLYEASDGHFNFFKVHNGKIYVQNLDEDGNEQAIEHIGYYRALSQAERMKSNSYNDCDLIIFEEFLATNGYLPDETDLLESIISTVARRRAITIYMIGNKISRNSIYFSHFSLLKVPYQKEGTIDIYNMQPNPPQYNEDGTLVSVKIAVEMCKNESNNSKMFFGHSQKAITSGEWNSEQHPIYKKSDTHNELYTMCMKFRLQQYLMTLKIDEYSNIFWHVTRKTTPIKEGTRTISDIITYKMCESSNMRPLNSIEDRYFNLLYDKKIFFSDNITGTEFFEALEYFKYNMV